MLVQLQPGDVVTTGTHHAGLGPVNGGDVLEIERLGRTQFLIKSGGPPKDVGSRGSGAARSNRGQNAPAFTNV